MVDAPRIHALIDTAERYADLIAEFLPAEFDEYASNAQARLAVERALQVAIESLIDVAAIIVSSRRLGLPATEEAVVDQLEAAAVLPRILGDVLRDLRRFRNVIVHQYGRLDDALVFDHAQTAPADIRRITDAYRAAARAK